MREDIEGNLEMIVGEVDQSTFFHCVNNYRERLSDLNDFSLRKKDKLQKVNIQLINIQETIANKLYQDINGIKKEQGKEEVKC